MRADSNDVEALYGAGDCAFHDQLLVRMASDSSKYTLRGADHYKVRPADQPLKPVYDEERLPRFLFIGAACMATGILILLCRQLPDFFVRSPLAPFCSSSS